MGSSTASGANARRLSWATALQNSYASSMVSLFNIALGGSTTYAGLPASSLPVPGKPSPDPSSNVDAALQRLPALLLLSYPTNDTANDYSVDETVNNLLAIRAAANSRGTSVIIVSTQPRNMTPLQLARLPQIDARVSAAVLPCFVPVREALAGPDGKLSPLYDSGDGIHPNDAGHAVIHARVINLIDSGTCVRLAPR